MEKEKMIKTTIRVKETIWKEYKKWLIDNGYDSINQHLNEVIEKIIKGDSDGQHSDKRGNQ